MTRGGRSRNRGRRLQLSIGVLVVLLCIDVPCFHDKVSSPHKPRLHSPYDRGNHVLWLLHCWRYLLVFYDCFSISKMLTLCLHSRSREECLTSVPAIVEGAAKVGNIDQVSGSHILGAPNRCITFLRRNVVAFYQANGVCQSLCSFILNISFRSSKSLVGMT